MPLKYNIILQTHGFGPLPEFRMCKYRVLCVFTICPLAMSQERSRKRAVTTGKFFAATMADMDKTVERYYHLYIEQGYKLCIWANLVVIADTSATKPRIYAIIDMEETDLKKIIAFGGEKADISQIGNRGKFAPVDAVDLLLHIIATEFGDYKEGKPVEPA